MIYLDYAATTPILDEVLQAMAPFQREAFGNPSSVYGAGREAKKGMEEAREKVADAIGAQPSEIVFTAGGTEADNLALKGAAFKNAGRGKHIVTVTSEHHAVLHSAQWLARHGFELSVIGVDGQGIVDLDELRAVLRPETVVVSVMQVNNEVGTIQPIDKIAAIVREHSRALLHADAVQGLGKIPVDVRALDVDLASFSAHKLGGPKGTGALFVKRGTSIEATVQGGGQERDFRSGTPNVAGIAGFGAAAEIAAREVDAEGARLGQMRDRLQEELLEMPGVTVNGAGAPRIPQTLNVCISRVEGESLLLLLDQNQIAASSGSACTSGSLEPSHVLAAMGVPQKLALGALRVSIGRATTDSDLAALTSTLPEVVSRLRSIGSGRAVRAQRQAVGS